jgi:hypothetical protein
MITSVWRRLGLSGTRRGALRALIAVLASIAVGCAPAAARRQAPPPPAAGGPLPEPARLDVQILVFDTGVSEDEEDAPPDRIYPPIRRAEARFFPCLLRETLVASGQWGAVEIAPRQSDALEVTVRGRIVRSDGEKLEVDIDASDATGRRWLRKRYKMTTTESQRAGTGGDAYQALFDAIANDLATARGQLTEKELRSIRAVAELRFAEDFAPDAFSGYLEEEDGELHLVRLPARDDPMVPLLSEVRGREAMFVSTQSGHYTRFCADIAKPYGDWRQLAREEAIAYRKLRRQGLLRKGAAVGLVALTVLAAMTAPSSVRELAVIAGAAGTIGIWASGSQKQAEAEYHKDTLEEINRSFQDEVHPMVVAVEGRSVKLTGTVDEQYEEWRRLLHELYEAELGAASGAIDIAETDMTSSRMDIRIEGDDASADHPGGSLPHPAAATQPGEQGSDEPSEDTSGGR